MPSVHNNIGHAIFYLAALLGLGAILEPSVAWAVQAHGGSEGLVSHPVGHILFFGGMVSLLIRQYHLKLSGPGWREFKLFLWFIILWNILTFSGHWLHEVVDLSKLVKTNGHTSAFLAETSFDLIFYATRLDHLLLVPAFFCLLLALRRWEHTS